MSAFRSSGQVFSGLGTDRFPGKQQEPWKISPAGSMKSCFLWVNINQNRYILCLTTHLLKIMKKIIRYAAMSCVLPSFAMIQAGAVVQKSVIFPSQHQSPIGQLFLPDGYREGEKLPGVVVTGAWTTVKKQIPATSAAKLAERGYAIRVLDFRAWGQSRDGSGFRKTRKEKPRTSARRSMIRSLARKLIIPDFQAGYTCFSRLSE